MAESNPVLEGMKNLQLTLQRQQEMAANARQSSTAVLHGQAAYLNAISALNRPTIDPKVASRQSGGLITGITPGQGTQDIKSQTQLAVTDRNAAAKKALAEFEASKKDEAAVMAYSQALTQTFGLEGSAAEATKFTRTAKETQATVQGKGVSTPPIEKEFGKKRFNLFGDSGGTVNVGDLINIYGQEGAARLANGLEKLYQNLESITDETQRQETAAEYQRQLDLKYPELKKFNLKIQ